MPVEDKNIVQQPNNDLNHDLGHHLHGLLTKQNQMIDMIGNMMHQFTTANQRGIRNETKRLKDNQTSSVSFNVQTIYVDNSNGGVDCIITSDKGVSFVVSKGLRKWIQPMGGSHFDISASGQTGSIPAVFFDTLIPVSSEEISASVTVNNTSGNPVQTQLMGRNAIISQPAALQNLVNTVAGTMSYFAGDNVLNAGSSKRIIGFKNTGNQSVQILLAVYIKTIGGSGSNVSVTTSANIAQNGVWFVSNGQLNEIDAPWDSITVGINYTTLPTSGGVNVVVSELPN